MSKSRLGVSGIALVACAALSACAGQNSPASPPTAQPDFPNDGSTYSYVTSQWGLARPGRSAVPQPIPTASYTEKERVTTGASFEGRDRLIRIRYEERDPATSTTGDEYLAWDPLPAGHLLDEIADAYAYVTPGSPGTTFTGTVATRYATPVTLVQVPFATGNTWNGASQYRRTDETTIAYDGKTTRFPGWANWNLDGSYQRDASLFFQIDGTQPLGVHTLQTVTSDGTVDEKSIRKGVQTSHVQVGVPRAGASGTHVIPVTIAGHGTTLIPDWYPGGGLPQSPLVKSTVVDRGTSALPASCGVPRSIATSGEKIVTTESDLDPAGGFTTTTQESYYADGVGMVCTLAVVHDEIYDIRPPSGLIARETLSSTTSLTAATSRPSLARADTVAGAIEFARGSAIVELVRRHVAAAHEALLRRTAVR